jgi:hypothetical protein
VSGWGLHAMDAGPFTYVLVALAAMVGALLIHTLSRRDEGPTGSARLPGVRQAMTEAAQRMDLPEHLLPALGLPSAREGDFVYRRGNEYVYASFERGTRMSEHRTENVDDLLYRVFRDRAWTRSYMALIGQDLTPQDHAARLAEGQLALLEKADPRWAERLRGERSE